MLPKVRLVRISVASAIGSGSMTARVHRELFLSSGMVQHKRNIFQRDPVMTSGSLRTAQVLIVCKEPGTITWQFRSLGTKLNLRSNSRTTAGLQTSVAVRRQKTTVKNPPISLGKRQDSKITGHDHLFE